MELKEPAIAYNKEKISIEQYFEMENASSEKHEYYKGEVFAMSGAKMPHNNVSSNLMTLLGQKLKGKPCKPYSSDVRTCRGEHFVHLSRHLDYLRRNNHAQQ